MDSEKGGKVRASAGNGMPWRLRTLPIKGTILMEDAYSLLSGFYAREACATHGVGGGPDICRD
ncbi:MAG: hypothetical protein Q8R30_04460 [bacterium]|nr:hypothetical protein [bacterium]